MSKDFFVIDMHSHIADPETPKRIGDMAMSNPGVQKAFEGIQRLQQDVGYHGGMIELNPSAENFIKTMRESGTDLAILSMLGFTEELNGIEISPTAYIADVLPAYRQRFLGFAGIDPRLPDAADKIDYYVREKGFSGAKINPNDWGTFPLDSLILTSIFEKCLELGVPIHIHTGVDPTGLIENANPLLLDKVANKYPGLKILLEHYGFPYKYEAYAMCRKHDNVYLTLAWHFNKLVHHNKLLAWLELEGMRIHAGIDKILYGSDYPATPNLKEVIDFLKYTNVPIGLRISGVKNWTYEMRAKVLGLNAARVLSLTNKDIEKIQQRFETQAKREEITLDWSPEALNVLAKIPQFIRKSAIKKIEKHAKIHGIKVITPEVMEKARKE